MKDETGRLYKLLAERDLELRQMKRKYDQEKSHLSAAGTNNIPSSDADAQRSDSEGVDILGGKSLVHRTSICDKTTKFSFRRVGHLVGCHSFCFLIHCCGKTFSH